MFNPEKPYNQLPLLPPKVGLERPAVMKQLVKSHKALAELKGYAKTLPNEAVLLHSIVLQEAKDSSAIENIVTTHDELFQGLTLKQNISPQVKEVLNYRSALLEGFGVLKKRGVLSVNGIIAIQERLECNSAGVRKLPGTALKNDRTGEIVYTPPDNPDTIKRLTKNLEEYFNTKRGETDPLIKMAVAHYQFESIHPFYDGNGRTGRIINVLYLILENMLSSPILYLSRYIIQNKPAYYRLLQEVRTKNAWIEWILYMLKAVEETSAGTLQLIDSIRETMEETAEIMKKQSGKLYSREFLDLLFEKPYIRISDIVDEGIASRNIASNYLKTLEKLGIVRSEKKGRDILYINIRLYNILKK
ncbi:MAG: Fic family protein [Phycisphaerae bacterium]|nr:Fic family protein [Phycisphaerae bacterium]